MVCHDKTIARTLRLARPSGRVLQQHAAPKPRRNARRGIRGKTNWIKGENVKTNPREVLNSGYHKSPFPARRRCLLPSSLLTRGSRFLAGVLPHLPAYSLSLTASTPAIPSISNGS